MKVGDAVTLVVASFAPARRSIDCAVPNMASVVEPQDGEAVGRRSRRRVPQPPAKRAAGAEGRGEEGGGGAGEGAGQEGGSATDGRQEGRAEPRAAKKAPATKAPHGRRRVDGPTEAATAADRQEDRSAAERRRGRRRRGPRPGERRVTEPPHRPTRSSRPSAAGTPTWPEDRRRSRPTRRPNRAPMEAGGSVRRRPTGQPRHAQPRCEKVADT